MLPLAIAAVMVAPPARGQIAVVSITGEPPAAFSARVREAGAYPLKTDADGRALVVFGDDPALFFKLLAKGLVAVRPPVACGSAKPA
ncbi:hypothetical protein [Qipengyuania sphaerica]|uniref:hypothetical protein n=1 Tax=Qipengyuania sphaerica TaxID=2867243 RepID=UPI001C8758F2|nr:hypothetical protein [Qipengyuania sphaerica]MBX7540081.1 hypothetical protein [Qipengyuania sphaerica]